MSSAYSVSRIPIHVWALHWHFRCSSWPKQNSCCVKFDECKLCNTVASFHINVGFFGHLNYIRGEKQLKMYSFLYIQLWDSYIPLPAFLQHLPLFGVWSQTNRFTLHLDARNGIHTLSGKNKVVSCLVINKLNPVVKLVWECLYKCGQTVFIPGNCNKKSLSIYISLKDKRKQAVFLLVFVYQKFC